MKRLLLLALYLFIPSTASIIGRIYYHFTSLHTDTITYEWQTLLHATILLPLLILVSTPRAISQFTNVGLLTGSGLWIWFTGALLSTFANWSKQGIVIALIASLLSAILVYHATLRAEPDAETLEKIVLCIVSTAMIPGILGIMEYYKAWGIPSFQTLLFSRYDMERMAGYEDVTFGNTGSSACFFVLLAAPCIGVLVSREFSVTVRRLCAGALAVIITNLVIAQSRTSLLAFALTFLIAAIYVRLRFSIMLAIFVACLAISFVPGSVRDTFWTRIKHGITYDVTDNSAVERAESIRIGWRDFLDHPVAGLGPGQSYRDNPGSAAHSLPINEAAENGILGLVGVAFATIFSLTQLFFIVKRGHGQPENNRAFIFVLGPVVYFITGCISDVTTVHTFHNTWICLVFGMLALAEISSRDAVAAEVAGFAETGSAVIVADHAAGNFAA